ncbi:hypothetical protein Tco_0232751 [Tanacetum coccineum]
MEVPDAMIRDAIKKKAGYTYYMAKKVESEKAKIVNEPEEQHVSPVKSRRGKGFMCYGELAHSIGIQEPRSQRRRRSQLTIDKQTDEAIADMYNEWGQKLKGPAVDDLAIQSLLDLRKGSKASRLKSLRQKKQPVAGEGSSVAHNKYYSSSDTNSDATLYSSSSDVSKESADETDDVDKSDMDLSDDNPHRDDDATSHPLYTDAHITLVVHNPEGNPELTSYISGVSEVLLGTHVDVLATKTLIQEMFPNENAHHIPYLKTNKISYPTTTPKPSSVQAKAKKPMQKAKQNIRKINIKKAVVQKFREYDQKLEALINFNVFKAFEKAVQAKVLTEIKTLLPTHIPNAIANYVRPRLNTYVLEDPPNNHEGENKKKHRKDVKEPSSRSSRRNRSHIVIVQDDTPAITKPHPCFYNNDYTYLVDLSTKEKYTTSITKHYAARYYQEGIEDGSPERWSKEVCRYHFEALNGIHHWEEEKIDFFKAGISAIIEVRRSDDKEYEFSYADLPRLSMNDVEDMYLLQVQDKLHHLLLEFVKGFNNALFMFIRITLGCGNKRMKGRDWTDYDVKSSKEMLKKIDEILKHIEQLRRLEEYVGRRPKTVNPHTFVRPL